ncbi:hypothetical protein D0U02_08210 [Burkholderia pseudomallei]|nr:hypothetical protein BOC39_03930 [Burkholderia pseudomallei]PNW98246.1 hypothetical protein CF649_26975 [Burkholderia sp. 136(2017)]PNX11918.1 hypothetical protein CF650_28270 [Burkholderia sp. 129]PNX26338.1 hypothetical protein CF647_26610 [Burkholderia sp. 117]PNX34882.1 hypothetical protein CF648_26980 [Burkholderia sp. 137]
MRGHGYERAGRLGEAEQKLSNDNRITRFDLGGMASTSERRRPWAWSVARTVAVGGTSGS